MGDSLDTTQSPHATSGASTISRKSRFSPSSSLGIPSCSVYTNSEWLPIPITYGEISPSLNLKAFSFDELKKATRNFHSDSFLAETGFSYVFKGWIDEITFTAAEPGSGMVVVVKKLKPEGFQGHKEWLAEVSLLGQLHHPNLNKLIGYCSEVESRFLVYEFMPNGNLGDHLFTKSQRPLSWAIRMKVAIGAARGLSFLHDAKQQVIHRSVKAVNILLDKEFNSKLYNIGFAKAGPTGDRTHVLTNVVIGPGVYVAPEYLTAGRLTAKSDVYSFGVVLLELLSGRPATQRTKDDNEFRLVDKARCFSGEKRKFIQFMDTRLGSDYPEKDAFTALTLALQCVSNEARLRPGMSEVLATLEQLQPS